MYAGGNAALASAEMMSPRGVPRRGFGMPGRLGAGVSTVAVGIGHPVKKGRVAADQRTVEDFCRTHGVREMSIFGSALRDDFGPESDIDVLVEFLPQTRTSLFRLVDMQDELTGIFGRQVDLVTKPSLHPYIRDNVLRSRKVIYVATR